MPTAPDHHASSPQRAIIPRRLAFAVGAVLIGGLIGLGGVYGIGGILRNASGDPACRPAADLAKKLTPLIHGEVAALTPASIGLRIPEVAFQDAAGATRKLSDWRG